MAKIDLKQEGTSPANPPATYSRIYPKSDGQWYSLTPAGVETQLGPVTFATPSTIGTTNTQGVATTAARSDHVHDHGAQTAPTHHAVATTGANGFMSSTDKTKLDGVATGATANATDAQLRDRATHTGTQLASTISDFAATVLATVLAGLSLATSAAITAADTALVAFGKLQAQFTTLIGRTISAGFGLTGGGDLSANRTLAVALSVTSASATAQTTTTSTTDVLLDSMTLTPAAGTYLVFFDCQTENSNNGKLNTFTLYVGGVAQTDTVFTVAVDNALPVMVSFTSVEAVNGSQTIEVQWKTSANTGRVNTRNLRVMRIA